eukprot:TRINITY_DN3199_c0_g1_i3.p1 TRINITY_DN3199_c0_g1~~TRINITY_DN3199_c0_g1_i3.p1  ORF type:complete len:450 (+),score=54.82 TRINITY_DN3199_c0_g1_i3:79-1428(+)
MIKVDVRQYKTESSSLHKRRRVSISKESSRKKPRLMAPEKEAEYQKRVQQQLSKLNSTEEEERLIRERREKRKSLMNRYQSSATQEVAEKPPTPTETVQVVEVQIPPVVISKQDSPDKQSSPVSCCASESLSSISKKINSQTTVDIFSDQDLPLPQIPLNVVKSDVPCNDYQGYYRYRIGELLNNRYQVMRSHGKGVFGNVLEVKDLNTDTLVAIKLLRNKDHTKGLECENEAKILMELREADPEGKCNVIKLLSQFTDKGRNCLVFENMSLNLRQLVKKYSGNIGLSVRAVKIYAFQLFKALLLLRKATIIHSDIKPDNILVSEDRMTVKLGDFGSAFYSREAKVAQFLVSRFYCSPEIILASPCGYPVDVFSLGACLYEIATGSPLFPSKNNSDHLRIIMELKGPIPKKILAQSEARYDYFDTNDRLLIRDLDSAQKVSVFLIIGNY